MVGREGRAAVEGREQTDEQGDTRTKQSFSSPKNSFFSAGVFGSRYHNPPPTRRPAASRHSRSANAATGEKIESYRTRNIIFHSSCDRVGGSVSVGTVRVCVRPYDCVQTCVYHVAYLETIADKTVDDDSVFPPVAVSPVIRTVAL